MMKQISTFFTSIGIIFFILLTSCNPIVEITPELILAKEELTFTQEGGSQNLAIKANQKWSVSSSESWCVVTPDEGEAGTKQISVIVSENLLQANREANITITVGNLSKNVKVIQTLKNILIIQPQNININYLGGDIEVNIQSALKYSYTIKSEWIQHKLTSGDGNTQIFTISTNQTNFFRVGKIIYNSGLLSDSVVITQDGSLLSIPADESMMTTPIKTLASRMFMGWNLGNTLEVPGNETGWGNPKATQLLIDSVKAAGFNAIRIPCAWDSYIEDRTIHKIKLSWLVRVKEVVDYCFKNNMYVILNIHWDGGWLENNCTTLKQVENNAKQKALWEQIAVFFRDYDEHLMFASANEPNVKNATEMSVLLSYHQTFVNAVRATGGRNAYRILVIQGPSTDITKTSQLMTSMPTDIVPDRMMAEIHYYTPWNFCGMVQDESWGKMFYYWGSSYHSNIDTSRNATYGEENELTNLFKLMKTKFVDNGIPVILGEFGVVKRNTLPGDFLALHLASRAYFYEFLTKQAKNNGLIPFLWDTGIHGNNDMGIINRNTGAIGDRQAYTALIKGATDGIYPF